MRKQALINLILVLACILGLSLVLYPIIGTYINASTHSGIVSDYSDYTSNISEEFQIQLDKAIEFNKKLLKRDNPYRLDAELTKEYEETLDPFSNGIMGYIEIPELGSKLPIYHTVSDSVLSAGIGHLEWSSLPVGGESTHSVISGHRGLTGMELFNNLDQLQIDDTFMIKVLNETLTYKVDQILVVEPNDLDDLTVITGEDYCTLVTCTPYRINSHRLLVRGTRVIDNDASAIRISSEATQIDSLIVAPIIGVPVFLVILAFMILDDKKKYGGGSIETSH